MKRKMTPAAEKLREFIRGIYAPIDWEKVNREFDSRLSDMNASHPTHYSARGLSEAAGVTLHRVLMLVGKGIIRPSVKLRNSWVFVAADLTTIRQHLTPNKTIQ